MQACYVIQPLASCPLYNPLPNRYFGNIQENEYINLLKCSNRATAFNIGNYIVKALRLREVTLLTLQNPDNSPSE